MTLQVKLHSSSWNLDKSTILIHKYVLELHHFHTSMLLEFFFFLDEKYQIMRYNQLWIYLNLGVREKEVYHSKLLGFLAWNYSLPSRDKAKMHDQIKSTYRCLSQSKNALSFLMKPHLQWLWWRYPITVVLLSTLLLLLFLQKLFRLKNLLKIGKLNMNNNL